MKKWALVSIACACALVGALVGTALGSGQPGTLRTGRAITQVKMKYGEVLVGTPSGWTDVDETTIKVPAGSKAVILTRFNAMGECEVTSGTPSGSCELRVLVGSKVAKPVSPTVVATVDLGVPAVEGLTQWSIERSSVVLDPGTYTVRVQHRVFGDAGLYVGIYGWHLTTERIMV
jgi:hypothetical protein